MSRNSNLRAVLAATPVKEQNVRVQNMPNPDTVNNQGFAAYSKTPFDELLSLLCTSNMGNQFHESALSQYGRLTSLINTCAAEDLLLTCKMIVYARTVVGKKSVNHLAAALIANHLSGTDIARHFYSTRNPKKNVGGTVNRLDDTLEIMSAYIAMNKREGDKVTLPAAMKKGFAQVIENAPTSLLLKYKNRLVDVINMVHPNVNKSNAVVEVSVGEMRKVNAGIKKASHKLDVPANAKDSDMVKIKTITAIMRGFDVKADNVQTSFSEAGQLTAQAVKEGKITETQAQELLSKQKAETLSGIVDDGKMGIMETIMRLDSFIKNNVDSATLTKVCDRISDGELLRNNYIFPYMLDVASEIITARYGNSIEGRQVVKALAKGFDAAVPNLNKYFPGRTAIFVDVSGSMSTTMKLGNGLSSSKKVIDHAASMAYVFANQLNADVILFDDKAWKYEYKPTASRDEFIRGITKINGGGTDIYRSFEFVSKNKMVYDHIILLSDGEANSDKGADETLSHYKSYVEKVADPNVYMIDLAGYRTTPLPKNGKIEYFYGYDFNIFQRMIANAFNPEEHYKFIHEINLV